MNKELFSENGEFISSRLASKKIGYSHDHISALIRSGKVSGKKVGRVWLVDFHSLENYKKSIDLKNFEPGKISGQMRSYTFKTKNHLGKNFLSVEKASKKIGYSQDHIGALVRGGKVAGQKIGRVWYVDFRSLRRHKKSQRIIFRQNVQKPTTNVPPIEPRLSLPHPISQKVIKYEEEVAPKFVEVSKDKYKIKKELLLRELLGGALITSMLIMVVTLASVSGIKQIAKTDTFNKLADGSISAEISQGLNNTSASILATISDGLQNLWNNLFGKKENTVLVVVPPDSLSNKEPTLKPSTSEGSGKTTIINNPPAQTIINEYKSITQVTPLDLTLDDVVNNGDTTRLDVRLLGNVEIGKNLNIKGSIVSGSSVIAKNGSFSSLSTSGDFSAGGEITLGNPEDNFIINSKNVSIDEDGNANFVGGLTATFLDLTGPTTMGDLEFNNATGTSATTTNLATTNFTTSNLNTNNLSLGTTSTSANINITQTANGSTTIQANRFTDAAPSGDFIRYNNAANDTTLFRVDNSGNLYAGGIINSGSQTITSTSQPQFRIQYDASNENTTSVTLNGVTTYGFNGTTPRAIFTPQSNRTDTFTFTDASSNPIFNIDTTNQRVGIGTTSPFAKLSISNAVTDTVNTPLLNISSTTGGTSTTTLFTVLASGNVGIGTTSPTNKLSVSGNADISGTLTVSGNAAFGGGTVQGNAVVYASKTITSVLSQAGLSGVLTLNPSGNTSASYLGGQGALLVSSGNVRNLTGTILGLLGEVQHSGTGILSNPIGVIGNVINKSSGNMTNAQGVRSSIDNNGTGIITNAYGTYAIIDNTNTGTTTNAFDLFAANGAVSAGRIDNYYGLYLENITAGALTNYSIYSAGGNNYFGGNVGIGTTNPGYKLDVVGNVDGAVNAYGMRNLSDGGSAYSIFQMWNNTANTAGFFFNSSNRGGDGGPNGFSFFNDAGPVRFRGNGNVIFATGAYPGVDKMILSSGGNFGIATSSPTYALSVEGSSTLGNQAIAGYFTATSTTATSTFAGAVGIGTTTPSSKFAITGLGTGIGRAFVVADSTNSEKLSVLDNGSIVSNGQITFPNSNGLHSGYGIGNSGENRLQFNGGPNGYVFNSYSNGSNILSIDNTGNIGVLGSNISLGTGSGSYSQVILSTSGRNWDFGVDTGSAPVGGFSIRDRDNSYAKVFTLEAGAPNGSFYVKNSGNVGIGTTSPTHKLSVEGSSTLGNQAIAGYFTATSTTATSTFAGDVRIANNKKLGFQPVQGYDHAKWNMSVDTNNDFTFNGEAGKNLTFAGFGSLAAWPENVSHLISGTGDFQMDGYTGGQLRYLGGDANWYSGAASDYSLDGSFGMRFSIGASGNSNRGWTFYDNTSSTIEAAISSIGNGYFRGSLGIGTTTPAYKLSVEGSSTLGNQAIAGYFTATSTTATSTFAGAVGIGTTTPTSKMSIVGNGSSGIFGPYMSNVLNVSGANLGTTAGDNSLIASFGADVGSGWQNALGIRSYRYSNGNGYTTAGIMLGLDYNTAPIMSYIGLNQNGNIGIGTMDPQKKLTIEVGGGIDYQLRLGKSNAYYDIGRNDVDGLLYFTGNQSFPYVGYVFNTGNLGIGTTSPYQKLAVVGNVLADAFIATSTTATSTFSGFIDVNGTGTNATSTFASNLWVKGGLKVGTGSLYLNDAGITSSDGNLSIQRNTSSYLLGGNVGIGTTTPNKKFVIRSNSDASFLRLETDGTHGVKPIISFDSGLSGINRMDKAQIQGGYDSVQSGSGGILNFLTKDTSEVLQSRMYLDAMGNVGIGTTGPGALLDLYKSDAITGAGLRIVSQDTAVGSPPFSTIEFKTSRTDSTSLLQAGRIVSGWDGAGYDTARTTLQYPTGADAWTDGLTLKYGNVGIGTTNPGAKLDIGTTVDGSKTLGINGADTAWDAISFNAASAAKSYSIARRGSAEYFGILNNGNWRLVIADTTGNVGIGTTTPGSLLHAYAGSGNPEFRLETAGAGNNPYITLKGGSNYWGIQGTFSDSNKNLQFLYNGSAVNVAIDNTGKVGIGNVNPGKTLDVTGTGRFSGVLTISNTSNCTGSQALQTNANGDIACGTINTGGISSAGGWTTNNVGFVSLSTTTDIAVVGASSTPYAKFAIISGATATTTLAIVPSGSQTANIIDIYNTSGALSSVFTAGGNLGIGTVGPTEKLHVAGNIIANSGNAIGWGDRTAQIVGVTGGSGRIAFEVAGAEKMRIDGATGNVGIGTTTPLMPLSIAANSGASAVQLIGRVADNISTLNFSTNSGAVSTYIQGNGSWLRSQADGGIHFRNGGTPSVASTDYTIEGMNLGINSTSPGEKLSVEGSAIANENIVRFNNQGNYASRIWLRNTNRSAYFSVSGTTADTIATDILPSGLAIGLGGSPSPVQFFNGASASVKMTIATDGNVGIGTTTPQQKLEVVSGNIGLYNTGALKFSQTYATPYMDIAMPDTDTLSFRTNVGSADVNGTAMVIKRTTGNVGIGTTTPSNLLVVNTTTAGAVGRIHVLGGQPSSVGDTTSALVLGMNEGAVANNGVELRAVRSAFSSPNATDFSIAVAGSERVRVDKSGNVGIGSSTPMDLLSIGNSNNGSTDRRAINLGAGGYGVPGNANSSSNGDKLILFRTPTGASGDITLGVGDIGDMWFKGTVFRWYTHNGGTGASSEKMRLTQAGNVGIGTTNPAEKLQVGDTGSNAIYIQSSGQTDTSALKFRNTYGSSATRNIRMSGDLAVHITDAGDVEKMTILNSGNVGIGITNPGYALDVQRAATSDWTTRIYNTGVGNGLLVRTSSVDMNMALGVYNGTSYVMSVLNNGNVGIGTTTPINSLGFGTGSTGIGFYSSNTTLNSGKIAEIVQSEVGSGNGHLLFKTYQGGSGGAERMRIQNDGNVGIGTTTPMSALHLVSPNTATSLTIGNGQFGKTLGLIQTSADTSGFLRIQSVQSNGSTYGNIVLNDAGGNVGIGTTNPGRALDVVGTAQVRTDEGGWYLYSTANAFRGAFYDNGTYTGIFGDGSGSSPAIAIENSNVGIGTTGPGSKLSIVDGAGGTGKGFELYYGSGANRPLTMGINRSNGDGWLGWNAYQSTGDTQTYAVSNFAAQILSADGLRFKVAPNGTGGNVITWTDAMTILSGGNVGIGTTNPSGVLQVGPLGGTPAGWVYLNNNVGPTSANPSAFAGLALGWNATNGNGESIIAFGTGSGSAGGGAARRLSFVEWDGTTRNERLTIDEGGNIGVGTTSPYTRFAVVDSTSVREMIFNDTINSAANYLTLKGPSGVNGQVGLNLRIDSTNLWQIYADNNQSGASQNGLAIQSGGGVKMFIQGGGNVGIGTTTPIEQLTVYGATNPRIGINAPAGTSVGLNLYEAQVTKWTVGKDSNNKFLIARPGQSDFYIDTSGNVGIGTTTPATMLEISGTANIGPQLTLRSTSANGTYAGLKINTDVTTNNSSRTWFIGSNTYEYGDFALIQSNTKMGDPVIAGTDRFHISAGGNVGIGITNPAYKLEVKETGGAAINLINQLELETVGTNTWAGVRFTDGVTANAFIGYITGTGASDRLLGFANNSATSQMVINGNGNVGIGTTNPANAKLDVNGNISLGTNAGGGTLYFGNDAAGGVQNRIQYAASEFGLYTNQSLGFNFYNSGTNAVAINANGKVGIGTTSPLTNLHVYGTSYPWFMLDGNGTTKGFLAMRVNTATNNDVNVFYGNDNSSKLIFNRQGYANRGTAVGETAVMTLDSTGNVGIGTTNPSQLLTLASTGYFGWDNGAGTVDASLYRAASGIIRTGSRLDVTNASGILTNSIAQYTASNLVIGNAAYNISMNGNVGIGTTSPGVKFDVLNSAGGTVSRFYNSGTNGVAGYAATPVLAVSSKSNGTFTAGHAIFSVGRDNTSSDYFNITDTLFTVLGAGNVGIGTTNPGTKLEIVASGGTTALIRNTDSTSYGGLRVYNDQNSNLRSLEIDYSGSTYAGSLVTGGPTGESASIATTGAYPLVLGTNNTARMTILSGGNVGIGTTAPGNILEIKSGVPRLLINGTTNPGYRGIEFQNTGTSFASTTADASSGEYRDSIGPITPWGGFRTFYTDTVERMRITSTGNVGIGTTNPSTALYVVGEITASTVLNAGSYVYTGDLYHRGNFRVLNKAANDFVTWATRDTSGSESVMNLSSIGTITTSGAVTINASGAGAFVMNGSGGTDSYIRFADAQIGGQTAGLAYLQWQRDNNQGRRFSVNVSSNGGVTNQAMTIMETGNVGIGTTTPAEKLNLYGGNIRLSNSLGGTGEIGRIVGWNNIGTQLEAASIAFLRDSIGDGDYGAIAFNTLAGSERMRIASTGNVGIGTTSPVTKLEVASATDGDGLRLHYTGGTAGGVGSRLTFNSNTNSGPSQIFAAIKSYMQSGNDVNYGGDLNFYTADSGNAGALTQRMTILTGGNVGIGTTAPGAKLDIYEGGSVDNLHLYKTSGGAHVLSMGTNFGGGNTFAIDPFINGVDNGGFSIYDVTNSVNRLVIAPTTGNIGVGTVSPGAKLSVSGGVGIGSGYATTAVSDGNLIVSGNVGVGTTNATNRGLNVVAPSDVGIEVSVPRTTGTNYAILASATGAGAGLNQGLNVGASGATSNYSIRIASPVASAGNYAIYSDATAQAYFEGSVGIGVASPGQKLDVNGISRFRDYLNFGATDAEGILTWTSDIGGGQASLIVGGNSGRGLFLRANGSNSTGAYINTSGNLGVGTTSPIWKFVAQNDASGGGAVASFINATVSNGNQTQIYLGKNASANSLATIAYVPNATAALSTLRLGLYGSSDSFAINGSGYVGIGTTTPASLLTVVTASNDQGITLQGADTGITPVFKFNTSTSTTRARIGIAGNNDALATGAGQFDLILRTEGTQSIMLAPTAAVAMTIESGGQVGVGDTTPDYGLDVVGDINSDDCFREAGAQIAGTCASDLRLKHNINSLNGSLEKIMQLRPVEYEWNEDVAALGGTLRYVPGRQVGLIAQEMQLVFPNLVKEKNGYLSVSYNLELQMATINAIQELGLNFNLFSASTTASLSLLSQSIQDQSLKIESMQADIANLMNTASTTLATLTTQEQRISDIETLIASSTIFTTATSTEATSTLSNGFISSITAWLGDMANGITKIFAKEVNTESLCVSDASGAKTCINKTQLDALILNSLGTTAGSSISTSPIVDTSSSTPTTTDVSTSTSTPILDTGATTPSEIPSEIVAPPIVDSGEGTSEQPVI